jgi:hypothetical protein
MHAFSLKKVINLLGMGFVRAGLRFAKTFFTKRCKLPDYDYRAGESGVLPLKTDPLGGQDLAAAEEIRLSLAGDWGTGTALRRTVCAVVLGTRTSFCDLWKG